MLGAPACNPGRPPAASVGGRDISTERVDDILEGFSSTDAELREQFAGAGAETYDAAAASQVLSLLVVRSILAEAADERGLQPSNDDRSVARDDLAQTLGGQDPAQGEELIDSIPRDTREWLLDLSAPTVVLQRELAAEAVVDDDALQAYYDENIDQFSTVCPRLIVVEAADVGAAQERLDAGEDFGAVSGEVSVLPDLAAAEGQSQCIAVGQLQESGGEAAELAAADEGDVIGPVPYDEAGDQQALIEAYQREVAPFAEVRESIREQLTGSGEAQIAALLQEEVGRVDVRVDPRFGRWDSDQGVVVAPTGPGSDADATGDDTG